MKSRKLPMEKRKTQQEISVTFTKRRQGLFNKAAELCLLCDSQIAILACSPTKDRVYSFGHSSVPSVIGAFLSNSNPLAVRVPVVNDEALTGDSSGDLISILDDLEKSESVEELEKVVLGLEDLIYRVNRNPSSFEFGSNYCDGNRFLPDSNNQKSTAELKNFDEDMEFQNLAHASSNVDELMDIVQSCGCFGASKNSVAVAVVDDHLSGESSNEEQNYWSFTSSNESYDQQFLNANNNYQDTNIPFVDYWPSFS